MFARTLLGSVAVALLAAAATPSTLHAQTRATAAGVFTPIKINPNLFCTEPTSGDTCRTEAYVTGNCSAQWRDKCGPILQQDYQRALGAAAYKQTILPAQLADGNNQSVPRGTAPWLMPLQSVPHDGSLLRSVQPVGLPDFRYGSMRLADALRGLRQREGWKTDGNAVSTCREYSFKRHFDYEIYLDAVAACGQDLDCAYATTVGSLGGRTLYQRNRAHSPMPAVGSAYGMTLDIFPAPPADASVRAAEDRIRVGMRAMGYPADHFYALPKNVFFSEALGMLKDRPRYKSDAAYKASVDALTTRVEAARRKYAYDNEWAFAAQMMASQRPLGLTLAEREDIDRRAAAYQKAIAGYKQAFAQAHQEQIEAFGKVAEIANRVVPREPGDPYPGWGGDPIDSVRIPAMAGIVKGNITPAMADTAFLSRVATSASQVLTPLVQGGTVLNPGTVLHPGTVLNPGTVVSPGPVFNPGTVGGIRGLKTLSAPAGANAFAGPAPEAAAGIGIIRGIERLPPLFIDPVDSAANRIYDLLVAELSHTNVVTGAVDEGCLSLTDTRCDFSLPAFIDRWKNRYSASQEEAFQSCVREGGSDALTSVPAIYKGDADDLSGYFATVRQQSAEINQKLRTFKKNASTISDSTNGHDSLEAAGIFGASYNYDAGWEVKVAQRRASDNAICRLDGGARAGFTADVSVFGKGMNVVDTRHSLSIEDGQPSLHSHLTILSKDIYTPVNYTNDPDHDGFHVADQGTKESPKVSATFAVFFVPVTVQAYAALHYGYDVSLGLRRPNTDCNPDNVAISLAGEVRPWASVDALASLAVGVPGFQAGVRGDVELIRVSLPVRADIGIGRDDSQPDHPIALVVNNNGKIDLEYLNGKLELFLEALFWDTEATLFEWKGPHQTVPLWNVGWKFPLTPLNRALSGG